MARQGGCLIYFMVYQIFGAIAQWLEQAAHNRLVAGSNPAGPTMKLFIHGKHSDTQQKLKFVVNETYCYTVHVDIGAHEGAKLFMMYREGTLIAHITFAP